MRELPRAIVPVLLGILGLVAIAAGLLGANFQWRPLGSGQRGPTMPGWLARPFFVLLGIGFLVGAFGLWRRS
jgi:amino acid transporter